MAFNPKTGLVYFHGQETSMVYRTSEKFDFQVGQWNTGTTLGGAAGAAAAGATATPPQRKAFFLAWDPVAKKERWRIDFTPSGVALSTSVHLVFVVDNGGKFMALDPATGLGHAGGYVGSGLSATNLAARTLRDLVLGADTDLTRLPWTGHRVRRWEPEPLRWLGVHALYRLYRAADRREEAGLARTSGVARVANRLAGR